MKKIAIIDDNKFVHYAIKAALQKHYIPSEWIDSFYSLNDAPTSFVDYGTIILEPNGTCYSLMQSFDFIIKNPRFRCESFNLILMTDLPFYLSKVLFENGMSNKIIHKDDNLDSFYKRLFTDDDFFVEKMQNKSNFCFTRSEAKIMNDIFLGYTHYQIANKSNLSIKTISRHKRNALEKLGVRSLQEFMFSISEKKCRMK